MFGSNLGQDTIYPEVSVFYSVPRLDHNSFIPDPFQLITQLPSYHSTQDYNPATDTIAKRNGRLSL
jgi:hypothetical protein